ncbi:thymine DNA glycosylase, tandem duplicate 1 isoform X1 [Rhinichthys klamathensis goyatoka]|uniref:thymine DNA glycosylase, tandem duplicate 1 isoform X1 n=2 Tax=Rhinichthys klamathensis goyatoka TaxID=3034132 RepID=UPI0024B4A798|nr:thymine DNA glycosylase, tandem duplicate 1 isoform X1 [Rhinichthys klamathensis goyatoka]XP_056107037.1 thymine DNA glycosylase, tandem duplicate 1 isoform X1 [Rhinichthys klamathensis goyatoka]
MDERLYGSLPHAPSEYLQQWVQSAQQHLQALQAQYPHMANGNAGFMMEGPREDGVMQQMPVHPEDAAQQAAAAQKAPAKGKRGRPASKEPKAKGEPKAKAKPGPKPKKAKEDKEAPPAEGQEKIDETFKKVKRKVDRFKGMSEEEVMKRTLPDILIPNLDYVIIGINPGLMAAYIGKWFPGPGNHFWKCLFLSGFTDKLLNHMDDLSLPEKYGIGFTNMVERATPGSKDLSSKELREGGKILVEKLRKFKPLIAVFNGKCIYEMFCREIFGKKPKTLQFGLQPNKIPDCETALYLMPSSSARCAQFPRAQDKVHFYIKLRELRDELKGVTKSNEVEEVKYTFDLGLAKEDAKRIAVKEEQYDPGYEAAFGGAYGESAPEGGQSNGLCNFSTSEETANTAEKAPTNPNAVSQVQDGQWMTQSFADQIPDIGSSSQAQTWGV